MKNIILSGNHGYEFLFPRRPKFVLPEARASQKLIQRLRRKLIKKLAKIPGAFVENKTYSLSLHTRTLNPAAEELAARLFYEFVAPYLKKRKISVMEGKKVLEIRPPSSWNKGKAVMFILKKMKKRGFPIYVGDDQTDEDVFHILRKKGLGIHIGLTRKTKATVRLPSIRFMPKLFRLITRECRL